MLHMGYFIIFGLSDYDKIGFGNLHFWAAEAGKLHKQVVP